MDRDSTRSRAGFHIYAVSALTNVKGEKKKKKRTSAVLIVPAARSVRRSTKSGASASIQPFVINFTLSWTTIFTLDRVRRIYRVLGLPTLRGRTQTQSPSVLQRAATSACCRPPGNRLSSVSLENCSPYFYHITSFLSHLPLPPGLVATTIATTSIATTTIIITSASLVFLLLFQLDALVDPFSHLHRTPSSPHFDPFPSSLPRPSISTVHLAEARNWLTATALNSAILLAFRSSVSLVVTLWYISVYGHDVS